MKSLNSFINEAGRGRPKKEGTIRDVDMDAINGKPSKTNGTNGTIGYNEPTDDTANKDLNKSIKLGLYTKEELDRNKKRLLMKFKTKEPFMIYGEAGWGKTSVIEQMAKRFGLETITIYLDKAEAVDLAGIPIPSKTKKGSAATVNALPSWAVEMQENPDKEFLLFFDEMNQATPDVMNALMPIVLKNEIGGVKFDNFFVGAAGNYEYENSAVSELSGPLKSRFKPIINWECGTPEAWAQATNFLKAKYNEEDSLELVAAVCEAAPLFVNPREVELKVLDWAKKMKKATEAIGDKDNIDITDILDRLEGLHREDLERDEKKQIKQLAETIFNFIVGKDQNSQQTGRSRSKGADMIDDVTKKALSDALRRGFIKGDDNEKYGISLENIGKVFCTDEYGYEPVNREMLDRYISKYEEDGKKIKYRTDAEFKKDGLKDPDED